MNVKKFDKISLLDLEDFSWLTEENEVEEEFEDELVVAL